jgi:hypothetical protein
MAGPLKNNRHELFVLALASGKSAAESYTAAGYKWNSGNCIRLKGNPRVRERLVELQQGRLGQRKLRFRRFAANWTKLIR